MTYSDQIICKEEGLKCEECMAESPCTECQYWPIYPCYSFQKPIVNCLTAYSNDPVTVELGTDGLMASSIQMYETMLNEGHDPRLLQFSKSVDGTIKG